MLNLVLVFQLFCQNVAFVTGGPLAGPRSLRVVFPFDPLVACLFFFFYFVLAFRFILGFNKIYGYGYGYVGCGGVGVYSVPCNRRVAGSNPPQAAA